MDNNKTIYAVMETDYSYCDIKGYFTNEREAESDGTTQKKWQESKYQTNR